MRIEPCGTICWLAGDGLWSCFSSGGYSCWSAPSYLLYANRGKQVVETAIGVSHSVNVAVEPIADDQPPLGSALLKVDRSLKPVVDDPDPSLSLGAS